MPRRRLTMVLLLAVAFATAQASFARTKAVQPGEHLQAAIGATAPGDTLIVPAGTYEGNLLLGKRLVLLGEGKPVIRGAGTGSVVTITADSCVFRNFVIEHSGTMLVQEDAGILVRSSNNAIEQCDLHDVLFGIYLFHAERNLLLHNRISGKAFLDPGDRGNGIHVWNSRANKLVGNVITAMRDGFYIQNAARTLIEENEVYGLRYGLHYMYADSNLFLRNVFHDNVAGAAVMYSRGIRMRHNVFMHNRGFASYGILFQDCHDMVADSNVIADNVTGMFFEASTDNEFRDNIVARNDIALQMFQNSVNNLYTRNSFIDNLSQLQVVGKRTGSRWSEGGTGNYWSGYDGYDLDGNGRGDVPMTIQDVFQYAESQNHNLRLYFYSPASQALRAATKAFPVLAFTAEQDSFPLMAPPSAANWPAMRLARTSNRSARETPGNHQPVMLAAPIVLGLLLGAAYQRLTRRAA